MFGEKSSVSMWLREKLQGNRNGATFVEDYNNSNNMEESTFKASIDGNVSFYRWRQLEALNVVNNPINGKASKDVCDREGCSLIKATIDQRLFQSRASKCGHGKMMVDCEVCIGKAISMAKQQLYLKEARIGQESDSGNTLKDLHQTPERDLEGFV